MLVDILLTLVDFPRTLIDFPLALVTFLSALVEIPRTLRTFPQTINIGHLLLEIHFLEVFPNIYNHNKYSSKKGLFHSQKQPLIYKELLSPEIG